MGKIHLSSISRFLAFNRFPPMVFSVGNMLHLIVEACISRNLIDTTAYLWHGYIVLSGHLKDTVLPQESPWLNFMQGAPLSDPLKTALISTPASRYMVLYMQSK
jgi:hypothetical protein